MEVALSIIAVLLFVIWLKIGKAVEVLQQIHATQIVAADMNLKKLNAANENIEVVSQHLRDIERTVRPPSRFDP